MSSQRVVSRQAEDSDRRLAVLGFGSLLAVSLAFDYSIYIRGLSHIYLHDLATLGALVMGLVLARRRGWILHRRADWIPLGLLSFLAINTIVVGAIEYRHVPVAMHKLFWFEHGDAIRILGGIAVWVWTFIQLDPDERERTAIFDLVLWGAAFTSLVSTAYWLINRVSHPETTPFDLTVMVALPLAMAFAIRRGSRPDLVRLAIFGGSCLVLYSRTAIVIVIISAATVLLSARGARAVLASVTPMAAGALVVLGLTLAIPLLPPLGLGRVVGAPPAAVGNVASGSSADQALRRAQQLSPTTLADRYAIWHDALRVFERSPVIGIGYHDYFLYSTVVQIKTGSNLDPPDLFSSRIKQAHNDYLSWLAEAGVIGLLLLLLFWTVLLIGGAVLWVREPDNRAWHAATFGFLVGLAAVSVFGEILIPRTPAWIGPTIVWWLLIAILVTDLQRHTQWPRLKTP